MKLQSNIIRSGFDGKRCLVHARCCRTPERMLATAQYLDIAGSDLFSGLLMSSSIDGGKNWTEFLPQAGLAPIPYDSGILVGCDATPMYHKKTGKVLLLGQTAHYTQGGTAPTGKNRQTFFSVYDEVANTFGQMRLITPPGICNCGNGSGQSIELENGDLLIPVYCRTESGHYASAVMKCAFDGKKLTFLEMGNCLTVPMNRGLYEPSLVRHQDCFYITMRNDDFGCVAKSSDGLHYTDLEIWKWQDGSLVDTYNTQQHFLTLGNRLYLVYTRRGANNDHVPRHRAPLFMAQVENSRLLRDTEQVVVIERGARLGNFGVTQLSNTQAAVMAAEWMQPRGCEAYGSDNAIFLTFVE